jgi:hypothetical protein
MKRHLYLFILILFLLSFAEARAQDAVPTPTPLPTPAVEDTQNVKPENLQNVPVIAPQFQSDASPDSALDSARTTRSGRSGGYVLDAR